MNAVSTCKLGLMILTLAASSSARKIENIAEPSNTFRWAHSGSDPRLWQQIRSAFRYELAPDEAKAGRDQLDVYRYKYLDRVGVLGYSALIILGRRPAKEINTENTWDEYASAFNFDLRTQQKSKIEHAELMWKWKFQRLATFGPSRVPDVAFTYLSCTECEAALVFASLYYDPMKSAWRARSWGLC